MSKTPSETVRCLYDAFNSNDLEALREIIAPDIIAHLPGTSADAEHPPGTPRDREGWLGVWQFTQAFFPDMQAEVQQIVETGDTVATRCVARGTHSVEFMGAPASGKVFEMTMLNMSRVIDGKIVEHWTISDNATMLAHLGIKLSL
ncbi:ester cyclase [Streptomyces sp. NPDC032198]|uniref:ester cyclase n=1 Tax=unclassified Streptomyces TaxID=2593676 RepID=UPI0033DC5AD7